MKAPLRKEAPQGADDTVPTTSNSAFTASLGQLYYQCSPCGLVLLL